MATKKKIALKTAADMKALLKKKQEDYVKTLKIDKKSKVSSPTLTELDTAVRQALSEIEAYIGNYVDEKLSGGMPEPYATIYFRGPLEARYVLDTLEGLGYKFASEDYDCVQVYWE